MLQKISDRGPRAAKELLTAREVIAEEQTRLIVDNAFSAIITINSEGAITTWNPQATTIFGWSHEEALGQKVADIIIPPQYRQAHIKGLKHFLSTGEGPILNNHLEMNACHRDGHEFPVELTVSPARSGNDYIFIAIIQDVTERKQLEKALLEIEERERQRIGYELHDGLGQLLAGISFKIQSLESRLKEQSTPEAEDAARIAYLIEQSKAQLKLLIKGIVPVEKDREGLRAALNELAYNTEKIFNVPCYFMCDKHISIHNRTAIIHLYRIAQEAVTNAVRHGKPGHIEIYLSKKYDKVSLTIKDDGKGFSVQPRPPDGMGLQIMNYRANMIGASLDITSETDKGTIIKCTFSDQIVPDMPF